MSLFTSLHKYYENCHDENGNFDNDKAMGIIKSNVYYGEERVRLLGKIYESVLSVKFLNKFSRLYLINSNMTVRDIGKMYIDNEEKDEKININNCRSQVAYCSNKINTIFPDLELGKEKFNFVTWLLDSNTFRLENNEERQQLRKDFLAQLNEFIDTYIDKPQISKKDLVLTLPFTSKVEEIDGEKFNDFLDIIQPYTKRSIDIVNETINDDYIDCVGYLKYIMSPLSNLSDEDKERRLDLLRTLGKDNEDIESLNDLGPSYNEDNMYSNDISDADDSVDETLESDEDNI